MIKVSAGRGQVAGKAGAISWGSGKSQAGWSLVSATRLTDLGAWERSVGMKRPLYRYYYIV